MGRVILLLDLDCFYAQCEIVRLGLPQSQPLALLQWNSSLAVNYPARALGIKRGDSFETIQSKCVGQCIGIHLPVIPVRSLVESREEFSADQHTSVCEQSEVATDIDDHMGSRGDTFPVDDDGKSLEKAYANTFCLSKEKQIEAYKRDKNRMIHRNAGKASLERYRLASAMIFSIVMKCLSWQNPLFVFVTVKTLRTCIGSGKFVLERASIDELFLDVSAHCYDFASPVWRDEGEAADNVLSVDARKQTVIYGSKHVIDRSDSSDAESRALWRGCTIAKGIRRAVFNELGFTLSAGISTNKLVAKLCASYGKPNGQAIIFPCAVDEVMDETFIQKVRNLGGKLGKKVREMLPGERKTMGVVRDSFCLNDLTGALGKDAGCLVFDACRGLDEEPVKETVGALTKSITAFKSFQKTDLSGIRQWIKLLASDVLARVEQDLKRNNRFPQVFTVYYVHGDVDWVTRSFRIPFDVHLAKNSSLEDLMMTALEGRGHFPIRRIGICAGEFEERARGGIKSFFAQDISVRPGSGKREASREEKAIARTNTQPQENSRQHSSVPLDSRSSKDINDQFDADLAFAQKLQSSFDREDRLLSILDSKNGKSRETECNTPKSHKKVKIEQFFTAKRK